MTKTVKLIDATATKKQAEELYRLLRLREAYNTLFMFEGGYKDKQKILDDVYPRYKANDNKLRRLGKRLWGSQWGTSDHKYHPMSWRNIHSDHIEKICKKKEEA